LLAGLLHRLKRKKWIVYAKPPFGEPAQLLRYLGRYTHRIAISNHRLLAFDGERVTFRWKDYAQGGKQRIMTLAATEFLRRFFLHVLPRGFVRIRHFGLLSNRFRSQRLPLAPTLLALDPARSIPPTPVTPAVSAPLWHCPKCGGPMCVVRRLTAAQLSLLRHIDSS
jgi:putative transposase